MASLSEKYGKRVTNPVYRNSVDVSRKSFIISQAINHQVSGVRYQVVEFSTESNSVTPRLPGRAGSACGGNLTPET